MNLKGRVIKVGETQVVSDKFSKRELWVEIPDGQYPQTICIEFVNAKTSDLDHITINSEVDVSVNLRGRVHKEKCYNTIQGWKIEVTKQVAEAPIDDTPF